MRAWRSLGHRDDAAAFVCCQPAFVGRAAAFVPDDRSVAAGTVDVTPDQLVQTIGAIKPVDIVMAVPPSSLPLERRIESPTGMPPVFQATVSGKFAQG